ncbi:MAG: hydroxysqualene dehydroxylase HpnE [Acidimicrobiales bacterium]
MRSPHVVVVGGGLAGLAAAVDAVDGGARVTLLERRPRLGGATWSFARDGISYDNGQHVFMRCCHEYRSFLDRIGSGDKVFLQDALDVAVVSPDGRRGSIRRDRLPAPLHLARTLATYPFLSVSQRAAAVRAAVALSRLDPDDASLDDRSFEQWLVSKGQGAAAIAALWELIVLPTVNVRVGEASLKLAARVFVTGLLTEAGGADIGWTRVPLAELHADAASAVLSDAGATVRTGAHVQRVSAAEAGRLTVDVDGAELTADAVVVAVPHDVVDEIVPPTTVAHQDRLVELGVSPIVNVHLVYDRPVTDLAFAAGLNSPAQFVFDRSEAAGVGDGAQCLAVSISGADEEIGRSPAELIATMSGAVTALFPAAGDAEVLHSMVTREVAATFRGRPGTDALRPAAETNVPGLMVAGTWTDTGWPATMESAVASGREAARHALAHAWAYGPADSESAA